MDAGTQVIVTIVHLPHSAVGTPEATLVVNAVELADTVLTATALVIIGLGLHALFVDHVDRLPGWLEIENLDDLEDMLVSVVAAVLAINFCTHVIAWNSGVGLLYLGAGIGLVILSPAALSSPHLSRKALTRATDEP